MKKTLIVCLLLLTAHCSLLTAFAQGTPGTVRFPTQLDTIDSLFQVADSPTTKLAGAISAGSGTITVPVNGTNRFPSSGSIKIDDEVVYYGAKTSSTFTTLTRGAAGTTAAAHPLNAQVRSPILAVHHNTFALSLIGTQAKLGFGASTPALNRVFFGTGTGNSAWVAQPAIDCTNCTNLPSTPVSSVFGRAGAVAAASNDYSWGQINKATSSLADITTRSAGDLSSGTLPDARFPSTLPALNGSNLTSLNASSLGSGTVPDARFPATLPALNAVNLTAINGSNISSGTVPDARLSNTAVTPGTYDNVTVTVDAHGRLISASRTYLVYTALLSQTSTSAPVATVRENTLGGTVVWGRFGSGQYTATLTGAFTASKTLVFMTSGNTTSDIVVSGVRTSSNVVTVTTLQAGGVVDDGLTNSSIEIRVYP